ncbi:MAG: phage terminase large subunit family protein, partial [Alphaproteobacteria bacterium]|nr:phage terminase large subunit family protein [Alphaproteobacteria bacterium]
MSETSDTTFWARTILCEGLRPDRAMPVSEWADRNRILPPTSAEPGRWRTARTPYLREVMDMLSATSAVERVVLMKGI